MSGVTIKIEGLPPEKTEKIARLLERLADKSDVLERLLDTLENIESLGVSDIVSTLSENREYLFNAVARREMMSMLGNAMMLLYLLSNLNQAVVAELAEKAPLCVERGYEEFRKSPDKRLGLLEMLNIMRSPEFAAALRALQSVLRCMRSG